MNTKQIAYAIRTKSNKPVVAICYYTKEYNTTKTSIVPAHINELENVINNIKENEKNLICFSVQPEAKEINEAVGKALNDTIIMNVSNKGNN